MKWQTDDDTEQVDRWCRRHVTAEFAPISCLNYQAEFIVDAINAEFRRRRDDERPAAPLTTALTLATLAAITITWGAGMFGLIVTIARRIGG